MEALRIDLIKDESFVRAVADNVVGTPEGIIVASTDLCADLPGNWSSYTEASGRMIVGAGSRFAVGNTGGEETVTLTVEQIPPHTHKINRHTNLNSANDNAFLARGVTPNIAPANSLGCGLNSAST